MVGKLPHQLAGPADLSQYRYHGQDDRSSRAAWIGDPSGERRIRELVGNAIDIV